MPGAFSRIDPGLQNSYAWLDEVAAHIDGERRDAFRALHAVLTALRDRLPVDGMLNLSNGMPLLIRGIFFDDFDPARHARARHAPGFVATVEERLAAGAPVAAIRGDRTEQANRAIEAVLAALVRHVDGRIVAAVESALPSEVRAHLANGRAATEPSRGPAAAAADA